MARGHWGHWGQGYGEHWGQGPWRWGHWGQGPQRTGTETQGWGLWGQGTLGMGAMETKDTWDRDGDSVEGDSGDKGPWGQVYGIKGRWGQGPWGW